jgi:TonB family protein
MKFFSARHALPGRRQTLALVLSLAVHVLALVAVQQHRPDRRPVPAPPEDEVMVLEVASAPEPVSDAPAPEVSPRVTAAPTPVRQPAFMAPPPAPTAQEWALASTYKLKNSKRYRYTWSQQVRSMMGTAYEGADQGLVRFRIEIAPDGRLTRLETLWSTSPVAERLARQAVQAMPPLPPTPTGQPLIFEQTIAFQPFDSGGPPIYRNDCLPDPPAFRNPFAWDGHAPSVRAAATPAQQPDPLALEECLKSLPEDTVEAESAHDRRQLE